MPTATVRYGRPKGSGLDDRQKLETIAALLAADPKLKPTTAIRSLGVEDPSTIRRLRDKLRLDQAKPAPAVPRTPPGEPANCNESPPVRTVVPARAPDLPVVPAAARSASPVLTTPAATFVGGWCDLACAMLSVTAHTQALLAQHVLTQPHVATALKSQFALQSVAVAAWNRQRRRRRSLH